MVTQKEFQKTKDGVQVYTYTMHNKHGMEVSIMNYGCRILNMYYPGTAEPVDVVFGFSDLARYEADTSGQGAFIGRYGNRIKNAQFALNGKTYKLTQNDSGNYLHGDFAHRIYTAEIVGENSVVFSATVPDGTNGFPGEMQLFVQYTLSENNELIMNYRAKCDQDTPVNLTNHTYFNLGEDYSEKSIEKHSLQVFADAFLETDAGLCPTGVVVPVKDTPMDFTIEKKIGKDIDQDYPALKIGGGYDHCYVLQNTNQDLHIAARLCDKASGRVLRVYTTEPAIQVYVANFLNGTAIAKNGLPMLRRSACCLETQHYPDSPNQPKFPSTILKAGKIFESTTHYVLG